MTSRLSGFKTVFNYRQSWSKFFHLKNCIMAHRVCAYGSSMNGCPGNIAVIYIYCILYVYIIYWIYYILYIHCVKSVLIRSEYGEIIRISMYSVWIRENADQNNSEYGHFSRSDSFSKNGSYRYLLVKWLFLGILLKIAVSIGN